MEDAGGGGPPVDDGCLIPVGGGKRCLRSSGALAKKGKSDVALSDSVVIVI